MQQHRGLHPACLEAARRCPAVATKAAALDSAITEFERALAGPGSGFGLGTRPGRRSRSSVDATSQRGLTLAQGDNFRTHTAMIDGMLTFIGDPATSRSSRSIPKRPRTTWSEPMLRVIPEITERLENSVARNRHHCKGFARADGRSGAHIADGRTRSRPRGDRRPPWSCRASDARAWSARSRKGGDAAAVSKVREASNDEILSSALRSRTGRFLRHRNFSDRYRTISGDIVPQRWLCWRRERPRASGNCG